jgi:tetratricopeptide (TPR) repeat protein
MRVAESARAPRRRWLLRRAAFGAFAALAAAACAPAHGAAYESALGQAARDEGAGRFATAARGYDTAATRATRARDADQARWDAAIVTARSGDIAAAARRFEAIAADPSSEHVAEAAYRLAGLRIDSGDADQGWRDMEQIPRRFPAHGVAHAAVRRLVQHADEQGVRAGLDELRALDRDLGTTELVELIAFSTAEHLEPLGDDRAARAAFVGIADRWPYPFGAFFDHALWNASLLDEKLGLYQVAIDDLERMLRQRETTSLVGSYERQKYVPAILRIGTLYRDRLHDRARAREAFHRLYAEFAHSTLRDQALWLEASLWHDDGDVDQTCSRLGTLVREFPDSRYVPCAVKQCPALERARNSAAPAECHDYIAKMTENASERGDGD